MWVLIVVIIIIVGAFFWGPRPRLDPRGPESTVPASIRLQALTDWLAEQERRVGDVIEGAEALIEWANPDSPDKTPLCFMYVHGFSATRQETAPVTERIAGHFGANTLYVRIAGHGRSPAGMLTPAEAWLQTMTDAWEIANRLGDKVVLIATSTGVPLSIWLASQQGVSERLGAMLFMSPNFRVRNRFGFLLTWPWSPYWLQWIVGKTHRWEPMNEEHAKYWSNHYSTLALIEMQKMVDWVNDLDLSTYKIPLALMYMKNDPVVHIDAAISAFEAWGAGHKLLIPVSIDGDKPDHVFAGRITAPHRVAWCVDRFVTFLEDLEPTTATRDRIPAG